MTGLWWVYRMAVKESFANRKVILGGVVVTVARIFLYGAFYKIAYSTGSAGLSLQSTVWSIAIFFIFNMNLGLRDLFRVIGGEVSSGNFEMEYMLPINWQLSKIAYVLGKNSMEFALAVMVLPLYLLWYVGAPDTSFWTAEFLLGYLVLSVLGTVSSCCLFMTIGLSAFWVGDVFLLALYAQRFILVLGGGFVPMALLPQAIMEVVRWLPFAVYGGPTLLFSQPIAPMLWSFTAAATLWTAVMLGTNSSLWRRVQRRIGKKGVKNA